MAGIKTVRTERKRSSGNNIYHLNTLQKGLLLPSNPFAVQADRVRDAGTFQTDLRSIAIPYLCLRSGLLWMAAGRWNGGKYEVGEIQN